MKVDGVPAISDLGPSRDSQCIADLTRGARNGCCLKAVTRDRPVVAGSEHSRPSAIRSAATNGRFQRRDEQHQAGHLPTEADLGGKTFESPPESSHGHDVFKLP